MIAQRKIRLRPTASNIKNVLYSHINKSSITSNKKCEKRSDVKIDNRSYKYSSKVEIPMLKKRSNRTKNVITRYVSRKVEKSTLRIKSNKKYLSKI